MPKKFLVFFLFLTIFLFPDFSRSVLAQQDDPTRILVQFKEAPKTSSILSVKNSLSEASMSGGVANSTIVAYETDQSLEEAIETLSDNPSVEAVFENTIMRKAAIPNDSYISNQWALSKLNLPTAWDLFTNIGGQTNTVRIAVLDTGVQSAHEDLSGKVVASANCTDGNCVSGSANDGEGHGTHVAGIIAAVTNNSRGVAGTAWDAKIIAVKVLGDNGSGTTQSILNGITWAADNGAKVINLSLGAPAVPDEVRQAYLARVNYAREKGAIVIAAAGNCGDAQSASDPNCNYQVNPVYYPAAIDGVLSVAASNQNDSRAFYSNHGNWVSVAAPGGDVSNMPASMILSSHPSGLVNNCQQFGRVGPTNSYCYFIGTSQASPYVAGVAALVFAKNPSLSSNQVKSIINDTANNSSATYTANGLVNAQAAVAAAGGSDPTRTPTPGGNNPTRTPTPGAGNPTRTPTPIPGATRTPTPIPSRTPTPAPPTPTYTPYPTGPYCPNISGCELKTKGDANCDGTVDKTDYEIFKSQYDKIPSYLQKNPNANFDCLENDRKTHKVNMGDFEAWRKTYEDSDTFKPSPTLTPYYLPTVTPTETSAV